MSDSSFSPIHVFKGTVPDVASLLTLPSSGYRVIEERRVTLSKKFAEFILGMKEVPGDRPLVDDHVEDLMRHMIRRTFLYENHVIASVLCKEDNQEYRVNAQHTCWAAYELEDKGIQVAHGKSRYIRYEADTMDDVRQLYSLYDRLRGRTRANVAISNLFDTPEFAGFGSALLSRLVAAYSFWKWDTAFARSKHDANEVAHLMRTDDLVTCRHVASFAHERGSLSKPDHQHFRRAPVMAAMLETFSVAPSKAEEFWDATVTGLKLDATTDARYQLRQRLSTSATATGSSDKTRVAPETMYRWCIFAWNAYRRGDPVHQLRAPLGTARPKAIARAGRSANKEATPGTEATE